MLEAPYQGGCQCGAVRYACSAQPLVAYTCHCLECQRLTSSAFATCIQVPVESLSFTRGTAATRERLADSGNRITTGFCSACGSALFSANEARPTRRTLYVGTLDRAEAVEVNAHIFTKRRLPWVVIPPGHRSFEEAGDWRPEKTRERRQ